MKRQPTNLAASNNQKLLNLAKQQGESFDQMLLRFGHERLLYRLSVSEYREQFLLKGALLFAVWTNKPHRPTRDIDLLGFGQHDVDSIIDVFKVLCQIEADDGLQLDANTITANDIKEGQKYKGLRVKLVAYLAQARIPLQIDIGYGDAVTPEPVEQQLSTLLDLPAPSLRTYPIYTVVAEKFHALVVLGMLNTRFKDFYDLSVLVSDFELDDELLSKAIAATFERRSTAIDESLPLALSEAFYQDRTKSTQWGAFLRKNGLSESQHSLQAVIELIHSRLWLCYLNAKRFTDAE